MLNNFFVEIEHLFHTKIKNILISLALNLLHMHLERNKESSKQSENCIPTLNCSLLYIISMKINKAYWTRSETYIKRPHVWL